MTLYTYGPGEAKVNVTDAWSHCKALGILECFARVWHTLKRGSERKIEI